MPNQTGPRTPQGKQASSQNRRRHGLSTPNIIVHPNDQPAFDEIESELRNEVSPDGPLETHAFHRLITAAWHLEQCRKQEGRLVLDEPTEQNKANLEKVHRYYLRWEGSYNSALRQLRLLQTDRGIKSVSANNRPESFAPLADLPKIERFAKRNAHPVMARVPQQNPDCKGGVADPKSSMASTLCETKSEPSQNPDPQRPIAQPSAPPLIDPILSALCETNHPKVGRNSPCPCGSGLKYKRCCGPNAAPILNKAA